MTDAELLAVLTEMPRDRFDPGMRARLEAIELAGANVTVYEVAGLTVPPAPSPLIIVAHAAPRPSLAAIREAYENVRLDLASPEDGA